MRKQIKQNNVIKIATTILLFLSINLNAEYYWSFIDELVNNIKQGNLESMKILEEHLFGCIDGMNEDTFLQTVEYINKKINFNFNATNEYGYTFLMRASRINSLKIVKSLIGYGADINAKNNDGETVLMLTSDLDIIKLLINNKADVNAKSNNGGTALMRASGLLSGGNLERIKLLIDNGADINAKDDYGETALMRVSSDGNLEIVKLLVDNGADINAKSKNGGTALTVVDYKNWEIVKLLIDNGADVNAKDNSMFGTSPLIIRFIDNINNGIYNDEYSEILEKIKFLIDKGADVNAKDGIGSSVLHRTIYILDKQRHHSGLVLEIAKLLIDNGANINFKLQSNGYSPLMYAAIYNDLDIVKLLVKNGADVNAKSKNGDTALTFSKRKGSSGNEVVKFLINCGAK